MLSQEACHRGQDLGCILRRGSEKLVRTLLAQMQFIRLAIHQVGNMEGSRLFALLAFHSVISPEPKFAAGCLSNNLFG
jgi:hypothetical protein